MWYTQSALGWIEMCFYNTLLAVLTLTSLEENEVDLQGAVRMQSVSVLPPAAAAAATTTKTTTTTTTTTTT